MDHFILPPPNRKPMEALVVPKAPQVPIPLTSLEIDECERNLRAMYVYVHGAIDETCVGETVPARKK